MLGRAPGAVELMGEEGPVGQAQRGEQRILHLMDAVRGDVQDSR